MTPPSPVLSAPRDAFWFLYRSRRPDAAVSGPMGRLMAAASEAGRAARCIDPRRLSPAADGGLALDGYPVAAPGTALARSGHLHDAADRRVLDALERLGTRVLPSAEALRLSADKAVQARVLAAAGVPVPPSLAVRRPRDLTAAEAALGVPLVLKPIAGSRGCGAVLCRSVGEIQRAMAASGWAAHLAQRYVASSHGIDLRVMIVDARVHGAMLRTAPPGGFAANIAAGGSAAAVPPPAAAGALAERASAALGLTIAGVDLLFGPDGFLVCEVNTAPGFLALDTACGTDTAAAILRAAAPRRQGECAACTA